MSSDLSAASRRVTEFVDAWERQCGGAVLQGGKVLRLEDLRLAELVLRQAARLHRPVRYEADNGSVWLYCRECTWPETSEMVLWPCPTVGGAGEEE